jgi:uncharacterized membrane protein
MKSSEHTGEAHKFLLGRHVRSRFVSGLFVLIPLAVTIFVLKLVFSALEAAAMPFVRPLLKTAPQSVLVLIAVAFMAVFIYLTGLIASHIIGQKVIRWGETVLLRLPLVKSVYTTSKQVVEICSTNLAAAFKAVVMVTFPHPYSLAMGFVTGTMLDPNGYLRYRIFVPTTPNPTSGFLVVLAEDQVTFTDISVEEGIRMIVSGGMLAPTQYKKVSSQLAVPSGAEQTSGA